MATASFTSNEGALESASAVVEVTATNPEYNQPALRIKQSSKRGGAASLRIDDPNPDIEFVEIDQIAPAGKYEIAVQSDKLQINGRNANDSGFEGDVWEFVSEPGGVPGGVDETRKMEHPQCRRLRRSGAYQQRSV